MGGRGRWHGGVATQESDLPDTLRRREGTEYEREQALNRESINESRNIWFEDQFNSPDERSDFFTDDDGNIVFKWVGMTQSEAENYFNTEIKPPLSIYEDNSGIFSNLPASERYTKAIESLDRYIVDDFQLGTQIQNYRDVLQQRMDLSSGYKDIYIDSTDTNTNAYDISTDRFDSPAPGLTVTTSSGKQGVVISQSVTSTGRNVSIVEFTNNNRVTRCACSTDNLTVSKI